MKIITITKLDDAQIVNPSDELFDLQQKYGVKISRSNKSNAVYVFKTKNRKVRIGHYIPAGQEHIKNFFINFVRNNVNRKTVEEIIKKVLPQL